MVDKVNKLELLENFDKANNGSYKLDDLAELIVEAFELGSEDVYEKIERVRELHKPFGDNNEWCDHCEIGQNSGYEWADYPCDTIKALDGITNEA